MNSLRKSLQINKNCFILLSGVLFLFVTVFCSILVGSADISPVQMIYEIFSSEKEALARNILLYVRIPRTVACMLAGAGLSVAGAILQRVLANKLASPSIIGVNAGAGLGVTVCCTMGVVSGWIYSLSAFLGSMLAVTIITVAAYRTKAAKTTVILGGVAMNGILNAISEAITVLDRDAAALSVDFRVGGFSDVSYIRLIPAGIMIIAALTGVFTLFNELDVLSMGDDTAKGLGMNVRRTKNIFLFLAALMAGASVSFAGLLGFIGLIVPHFVRKILGSEGKLLVLGSAIFGSAFLTLSDLVARTLFAPFEVPVGIIMAIAGGPVFILLVIRRRGGHAND